MVVVITIDRAQKTIADNTRQRRLQMDLTQGGLAIRAGVSLGSLRKFEQKGEISLESFLKIQMILGGLEKILQATEMKNTDFASINEVIAKSEMPIRKRGRRK